MFRFRRLAALGLMALAAPLAAESFANKGDLSIGHPWARETAAGQAAGGGFLTIANKGKTADRLTGGTTALAADVQVHRMRLDNGVMRMRRMPDGIVIPAGGSIALKPGSFHIMFMGLKRPLRQGETVPVTLNFARAGKVQVRFKVEPVTFGGSRERR